MKKGIDYPGVTIMFVCHDDAGNFLLQKRSTNCRDEHGRWDTGGGGLDFGATVENTLHKEVKEEYCTDVLAFEYLGYRDVHREHGDTPTHWIALDFVVLVDRATVRNGEPHKFDEIGWYRWDEFPQPLHSQLRTTLDGCEHKLRHT